MPTYDYRCQACGHEFEQFQSITASTLRKCPECGTLKLQRLIGTGAGVIFKGSGFYETDYRSDNYKKSAKAENDSAKPAGEATGAKSDSAATKSESSSAKTDTSSAKTDSSSSKSDKPAGKTDSKSGVKPPKT